MRLQSSNIHLEQNCILCISVLKHGKRGYLDIGILYSVQFPFNSWEGLWSEQTSLVSYETATDKDGGKN